MNQNKLIMKNYEVWDEGFATNGNQSTAVYLGVYKAETFVNACRIAIMANDWDMNYFDEKNISYWGCKFYDNEKDARKNFG